MKKPSPIAISAAICDRKRVKVGSSIRSETKTYAQYSPTSSTTGPTRGRLAGEDAEVGAAYGRSAGSTAGAGASLGVMGIPGKSPRSKSGGHFGGTRRQVC